MEELIATTQRATNQRIGNLTTYETTPYGIQGKTPEAQVSISCYGSGTFRIQISREGFHPNPYSVIASPLADSFRIQEEAEMLILSTADMQLHVHRYPFRLQFFTPEGTLLHEDDPSFAVSWLGTEVTNYKTLREGEKFIGLGEKTGPLNRAGNAYTNWNTDYFAYGVGDDPLYMSIPFYIGLYQHKAYGIFLDNSHKTVFNFGASNRRFSYFSAEDGDMDYYFFHKPTVAEIITAYTALTGKMELPPLWTLGFQQCRYSYYPDHEVLRIAQTFRDKQLPADVIYLDIHHMEKYKVFTFDGEKFPDPKGMIDALHAKGFKVVVIMDPGIKILEGYAPYDEGKHKDLFVKFPDGSVYEGQVWPGWCAFPDFTAEKTRSWWAEKMKYYTDLGVDGFWTDMNEPASWGQFTPNLIEFDYEGEQVSHRKARNVYGMQMARSAQEGSRIQVPNQRPFVLTRAGFAGIQRYAAAWTGDNVSSDEHMLAGIRLVNSLGLSGVPFSGYDVGGFAGEASKGLFARWMSLAAFSPFYRAHSMINSNAAEPWAFGEEVEEISKNYMRLRYRMLPLLYSSFREATHSGLPVQASLALHYPHDSSIYDSQYENQYLFCDQLLVAPVRSDEKITKVYLPEGDWYYLYDDTRYAGNQAIYVEAPLAYLPVFVKASALLPLSENGLSTSALSSDTLELHVYLGKKSYSFTYYEDAGDGFQYEDGDFYAQVISWDGAHNRLRLEASEGTRSTRKKEVKIYFHGAANDLTVAEEEHPLAVRRENYAFLAQLSEFDPLPEHERRFTQVKNLAYVTLPLTGEAHTLQLHF